MSNYLTLYIYIISVFFTIIYDLYISNGVNYITYNKRSNITTMFNIFSSFIWGLLIFLANYHNFNLLSWTLLIISFISFIMVIISNNLYLDLQLDIESVEKK